MSNIPWSEKYRPDNFDNIILNTYNKSLLQNLLNRKKLSNLLFYGPPGIGKTTTIINLIKKYQEITNNVDNSLIIHLNASDERGVDIIRNNIYKFVGSDNMFSKGEKIIILDEVDYMTKIAQQGLKCLIHEFSDNIYYCLICNYITKIDMSLQNEFIKIRFNKLTTTNIYDYLNHINHRENINISSKSLHSIITYYDSDIRSMINYLQSNCNKHISMLDDEVLTKLYDRNMSKNSSMFKKYIYNIEKKYNINIYSILKKYIYFVLKHKIKLYNFSLIQNFELIIHYTENIDTCINYTYYSVLNINKYQ